MILRYTLTPRRCFRRCQYLIPGLSGNGNASYSRAMCLAPRIRRVAADSARVARCACLSAQRPNPNGKRFQQITGSLATDTRYRPAGLCHIVVSGQADGGLISPVSTAAISILLIFVIALGILLSP
jgi:hypothetical protein